MHQTLLCSARKSCFDRCVSAGVVVDGEEIEADAVVIAMGPWSGQAAKWLPVPDITGQKYASIVLRPEEDISNHMLFLSYRTSSGILPCKGSMQQGFQP